ncbi:MAG TPA: response regulator [Thermoanaerobaculia bacterium]|jgi:CheY-like chemotaxis protein|nr:response regulator [Thermoanaerobaculia bacterium]
MGKRILLADDSVTIQKVVELTFMDEDYEVVAVSNGDDAVARLAETNPDLVIADVHMPGSDGFEVARRVKQWRAFTPVLLLVGTFEPFQEEDAKRSGADGYLKKPFDSQELLRRVEELLTAAASAGAGQGATVADEMVSWQAPEAALEPEGAGELYGGGAASDEPAGPLGQAVPEELVLEASPWTEAEENAPAEQAPPPAAPSPRPAPQARPPAAAPAPASAARGADGGLSEADVDRIARRVVELLGEQLVREVAWEVVPDMAELVIKDRIRELERQLESP